jgi:alpha-beta hydrolase superfamily lysophospholipase
MAPVERVSIVTWSSSPATTKASINMQAILVHGMCRTPVSMLLLARRLRRQGMRVHPFGYSTLQSFDTCVTRLIERVRASADREPFILVGHSLGCVLIRAAMPILEPVRPAVCFFLAPPSKVTRAASFFARSPLYRLLTRDSGQLLANAAFMASLPVPAVPFRVYAGTAGYKGRFSPFRQEDNDGILAISETSLDDAGDVIWVPALHTFIMNSKFVLCDIVVTSKSSCRV